MATTVFGLLEKMGFTMLENPALVEFDDENMEKLVDVLNYLDTNQEVVIHDINDDIDIARNPSAIVVLANGNICESFTDLVHNLHSLYVSRGDALHLSSWPCGGPIYANKSVDYSKTVAGYNMEMNQKSRRKKVIAYKTF